MMMLSRDIVVTIASAAVCIWLNISQNKKFFFESLIISLSRTPGNTVYDCTSDLYRLPGCPIKVTTQDMHKLVRQK